MSLSRISGPLIASVVSLALATPAAAQYLAETREVVWSDPDEPDLLAKATELGTPAAIYEFVRNEFAFASYDGARSNAANTFLHRKGNDVDLAGVLIAMLRSQGIPARYAEGFANFDENDVTSWLEIPLPSRAASHLGLTGYRDVAIGAGRIAFRHAWVQALVPLASYRGAGPAAQVDCTAQPALCTWVDLDPSFKRHRFRDPAELVDVSDVVFFDYDAFYNADNPNYTPADGLDRSNKGPLEVYEEQILQYLQTAPGLEGKTLEDVVYKGEILPESHGVLPTSLPFRVVPLAVQTYASVADHDGAPGTFPWTKTVSFTVTFPRYAPFSSLTLSGGAPVPLVDLSTENLTFAYESTDFDSPSVPKQLVVRLGGQMHEVMLTVTGSSYTSNGGNGAISGNPPDVGTPFDVHLSMDAAGANALAATYPGLTLGGAYLVATGGEHSSWSQVDRSARRLLQAVEANPVVPNEAEGGLLYVDANQNGSIDAGEIPLLEDAATQNLLTGGVLAVAKDLYYAQIRDAIERVADLQRSSMPPVGFLGLVSSVHDVRSVDGTAFQIVPSGLLVDMKAITVASSYKIDADVRNSRAFRLAGHVISSLEHEIWQELTGFEAISTMKGIQKAIADGGALLLLDEAQSQTSVAEALTAWGFQPAVPSGVTAQNLSLFGLDLWLPRTVSSGQQKTLSVIRDTIDGNTPAALRKGWDLALENDGSPFEEFFRSWENIRDQLQQFITSYRVSPPSNLAEDYVGPVTVVPGAWTAGSRPSWTADPNGPIQMIRGTFSTLPGASQTLSRARFHYQATFDSRIVVFPVYPVLDVTFGLVDFRDVLEAGTDLEPWFVGGLRFSWRGSAETLQGETSWFPAKPNKTPADLLGSSLLFGVTRAENSDYYRVWLDSWEIEYEVVQSIQPFQAYPDPACVTSTNPQVILDNLPDCFFAVIARPENAVIKDYVGYFDANNGFVSGQQLYRDSDPTLHVNATSLARIRAEVVLGADADGNGVPDPDTTVEFVVPSIVADGELLDFAVWIQRYFDAAGREFSSRYIINRSGLDPS